MFQLFKIKTKKKIFQSLFQILTLGAILVGCGSAEEQSLKFYEKGIKFFEKQEFKKAENEFKNSAEINPNFADAYFMLGMSFLKQGVHSRAVKAFNKCVQLSPENFDAQIKLSEVFFELKKFESAYKIIENVLEKEPENNEAKLIKAKILMDEDNYGDLNLAEEILQNLIDDNTGFDEAYLLLGSINKKKQEYVRSRNNLLEYLKKNPSDFPARCLLAEVYQAEGDLPNAEAQFRRLFLENPKSEDLKDAIVLFYLKNQKIDLAEKFLENLAKDFPKSFKNRMRLVHFYQDWGSKIRIAETLDGVIHDFPTEFQPVKMKAEYFSENEKIESSLTVLKEFSERVTSGPMHLSALNLMAQIFWQAGKTPEALNLTEKVLKENPGDFQANALKGDILMSQKDYAGAVAAYRTVSMEQPENVSLSVKIGDAHRLSRQFLLAAEGYKDALRKDPDHFEARLGLAQAYTQLGKYDFAAKQLKLLMEKNPENKEASTLLKEITLKKGS
jgi:tetratricopeptide (TPR) repeat protein